NIKTKVLETFAARKLEIFRSKEEILSAYLNRLPYGNQFKGCRAAARGYFGKPLADISVAEAAFLAGLPNKPTKFNPYRNYEGARERQFLVLRRMKEEGYISDAEFTIAIVEPLTLIPKGTADFRAPHFVDLIMKQQGDLIAEKHAAGEPLKTTLDLALQQFVESSVSTELSRVAQESGEESDFQAAVVVIDNATGEVRALTGSRSFFGSESGQINGAWTARSAGSTLKPFTYIVALEKGFTAASILADTPIEYVTSTGVYQPVNYDRFFHGPVTLRSALANSMNVPAVKILNEIGGPKVLHVLMKDELGFTSLDDNEVEYGLGLTLGNAEVRLLEMANAYACLARLG
ncbi:MAG: transglycosylase domain-containing protein, partial [Methylococcales bacterium]|nr:transglycosylase domain-containing protein [Methylococcales bacterium]